MARRKSHHPDGKEAAPPPGGGPAEAGILPPAWREALRLFGVGDDEIDNLAQETIEDNSHTDPDPVWVFSYVVTNSSCGIYTDWRGEQEDSLQYLADAMGGMGVGVELDAQDIRRLEVAITSDGQTRYYARAMPERWEDFQGLAFALAAVLPPAVAIYSLVTYEQCDGWGHAVLPAADWERVRGLLGPAFRRIFSRHRPSKARFVPSGRSAPRTWQEWVQVTLGDREGFLKSRSRKKEYAGWQDEVMLLLERRADPKKLDPDVYSPADKRAFREALKTPKRLTYAMHPLSRIADRRLVRGAVQILKEDPAGWAEYHAGLRTYYWLARLDLWATASGAHACTLLKTHNIAEFLAGCLTLGEWDMARFLFRAILDGRLKGGGWRGFETPVYPLTLRLCAAVEGVPFTDLPAAEPLGDYDKVFRSWRNPKKLAAALTEACEYHATQARRPDTMEFRWFPGSVVPSEVLAVLRTRRHLGLPVPDVKHPLLDTPLGRPSEAVAPVPDDLLDRLIDVVEEELPPL